MLRKTLIRLVVLGTISSFSQSTVAANESEVLVDKLKRLRSSLINDKDEALLWKYFSEQINRKYEGQKNPPLAEFSGKVPPPIHWVIRGAAKVGMKIERFSTQKTGSYKCLTVGGMNGATSQYRVMVYKYKFENDEWKIDKYLSSTAKKKTKIYFSNPCFAFEQDW